MSKIPLKSTPEDLYAFMKKTAESRSDKKQFEQNQTRQNAAGTASTSKKPSWIDEIEAEEQAEKAEFTEQSFYETRKNQRRRLSFIATLSAIILLLIIMRALTLLGEVSEKYNLSSFLEQFLDNSVETSIAQEKLKTGEGLFGGVERRQKQQISAEERELLNAAITPLDEKEIIEGEVSILLKRNEKNQAQQLTTKEQNLRTYEAMLKVAEDRIKERQDALNETKNEIGKLLDSYGQAQEGDNVRLKGIFESLEPKRAARIFDNLDIDVVLQIVSRMQPRKLAQILGYMDPARARVLTTAITTGRNPESNVDLGNNVNDTVQKALGN